MAEKSYTMDDLSLVKTEETVPLKRRSSQGDQPSRDNVSVFLFGFYFHSDRIESYEESVLWVRRCRRPPYWETLSSKSWRTFFPNLMSNGIGQ